MRNTKHGVAVFLVAIMSLLLSFSTVEADEVSNEIWNAINKIDENLTSPLAKAGLEKLVLNFLRMRIDFQKDAHVKQDNFKKGFMEVFAVFQAHLWGGKFNVIKSKDSIGPIVEQMALAYKKNENNFLELMSLFKTKVKTTLKIEVGLIRQSQIYFSLILFDFNGGQYEKAKKFTYIWPFC